MPETFSASMRVARGSAKQNRVYCGKDALPHEFGKPMQQGKRKDLEDLREQILAGATNEMLWDNNFNTMTHNYRAMYEYKRIKTVDRNTMPIVMLFVGPTGTGKSELAHILAKYLGTWFKVPAAKSSGVYFDGYDGQDTILIDEMDGCRCKPTFMNELCDKYANDLPVYGRRNVVNNAKYVIICSNYLPKYWWRRYNSDKFMRRLSILWFSGKLFPPKVDEYWWDSDSEESMTSKHERRMQYESHSEFYKK